MGIQDVLCGRLQRCTTVCVLEVINRASQISDHGDHVASDLSRDRHCFFASQCCIWAKVVSRYWNCVFFLLLMQLGTWISPILTNGMCYRERDAHAAASFAGRIADLSRVTWIARSAPLPCTICTSRCGTLVQYLGFPSQHCAVLHESHTHFHTYTVKHSQSITKFKKRWLVLAALALTRPLNVQASPLLSCCC